LHARYGTEYNHVDVTDRLRELARQDRRFRLTNDFFGVDPEPGQTKIQRIFTRDRGGQERVFEYSEYGTIDGSQFIGWGRGDWAAVAVAAIVATTVLPAAISSSTAPATVPEDAGPTLPRPCVPRSAATASRPR